MGRTVTALHRSAFGPLSADHLLPGSWESMDPGAIADTSNPRQLTWENTHREISAASEDWSDWESVDPPVD